jgi:hypothetical protein
MLLIQVVLILAFTTLLSLYLIYLTTKAQLEITDSNFESLLSNPFPVKYPLLATSVGYANALFNKQVPLARAYPEKSFRTVCGTLSGSVISALRSNKDFDLSQRITTEGGSINAHCWNRDDNGLIYDVLSVNAASTLLNVSIPIVINGLKVHEVYRRYLLSYVQPSERESVQILENYRYQLKTIVNDSVFLGVHTNCMEFARINKAYAYSDKNLTIVAGSLSLGNHPYLRPRIFLGDPSFTSIEQFKEESTDFHVWLENEKGDVWDVVYPHYASQVPEHNLSISTTERTLTNGLPKKKLEELGLYYTPMRKDFQEEIMKRFYHDVYIDV